MKVLLIHNYYQQRGGEDTVFEEEVKLLRKNGCMVETVEFTNENFDKSIVNSITGALKSLFNLKSAKRVEQAINTFKPDVVHIHNLFYTASPSVIWAAKRRGIPVVLTLHNYRLVCNSSMLSREAQVPCERCLKKTVPLDGIKYGCFRNSRIQSIQLTAITSLHKLTKIWQSVDRYIVLTEFAKKKFLESSLNLKPEQIVTKPNFINEYGYADFEQRESFFLYIGRLHFEKGIQSLVEATYLHNLPIEIIGDGPLRPLVEKAANELPHLNYKGFLPREEVIARMKKCQAIIVPSIWYEGLPTTILEAFATGTPVMCSDQKNLNEIVKNGYNGILFKAGSPTSIANAMLTFSKDKFAGYAKEGFVSYNKSYRKEIIIKKLISIYSDL